jgi:hypothetical protein
MLGKLCMFTPEEPSVLGFDVCLPSENVLDLHDKSRTEPRQKYNEFEKNHFTWKSFGKFIQTSLI